MTVERPDEQLAFEIIERVLGVRVEQYDIGSRQRAVDGLLHYPNGQIAALEVSSVGPPEEARISNMLDRPDQHRRQISGLRRNWMVTVRRSFHPADLTQVDRALLRCEELGLADLQSNQQDEQARALHGAGVRAHATDDARQPPVAWVLLEMIGGFTTAGASTLPAELDTVLRGDTMRSKIEKLAATGLHERHLVLFVRPQAFSFPVFDTLAFGGSLPDQAPNLPGGLSQLWLLSGWKKGGIVRAINNETWSRCDPFN